MILNDLCSWHRVCIFCLCVQIESKGIFHLSSLHKLEGGSYVWSTLVLHLNSKCVDVALIPESSRLRVCIEHQPLTGLRTYQKLRSRLSISLLSLRFLKQIHEDPQCSWKLKMLSAVLVIYFCFRSASLLENSSPSRFLLICFCSKISLPLLRNATVSSRHNLICRHWSIFPTILVRYYFLGHSAGSQLQDKWDCGLSDAY